MGGLDPFPVPPPPPCSTEGKMTAWKKMTIRSGYALLSQAATFSKSVVKR